MVFAEVRAKRPKESRVCLENIFAWTSRFRLDSQEKALKDRCQRRSEGDDPANARDLILHCKGHGKHQSPGPDLIMQAAIYHLPVMMFPQQSFTSLRCLVCFSLPRGQDKDGVTQASRCIAEEGDWR